MLKVAVPNKGALAEMAAQMLIEAGYRQRRNPKDLVTLDPDNDVEFFYLRPRDIAIYVGEGTLDVGVTGRDLLVDSGAHAAESMALGFGASTFRFACPSGTMTQIGDLAGRRVATSYPGIVRGFLGSGASRPMSCASTVPSSRRCASASRMPSPTSWRPAARCVRPVSRCSVSRSCRPKRS